MKIVSPWFFLDRRLLSSEGRCYWYFWGAFWASLYQRLSNYPSHLEWPVKSLPRNYPYRPIPLIYGRSFPRGWRESGMEKKIKFTILIIRFPPKLFKNFLLYRWRGRTFSAGTRKPARFLPSKRLWVSPESGKNPGSSSKGSWAQPSLGVGISRKSSKD